jgi:ABC-type branched-subunit amino acid transport system substrate-binding protein
MAPNYAAGKDMLTGFKRYFKGKIVDEVYTRLGQTDYQAELSQLRSKNPKAVFVFYPGGMGIQFLKQYSEAGLRGSSRSTRLHGGRALDPGVQARRARPARRRATGART